MQDKIKLLEESSSVLINIDDLSKGQFQRRQFVQNEAVFHVGIRLRIADIKIQISKSWWNSIVSEITLFDWIIADEINTKNGTISFKPPLSH